MMRLPLNDINNPKDICKEKSIELVDAFLESGCNYFDTAYIYNKGQSEKIIGEILVDRHPRESFILTDKMPCMLINRNEDYDTIFNKQLERTHTNYFDNYFLHAFGKMYYEETKKYNGFDWLNNKLKEGKVRHLGFSYHDDAETLDRILTEHPEFELVQLQINYADWNHPTIQSRLNYEVCVKHDKKVIVMGPLKGGSLVNLPDDVLELLNKKQPCFSCEAAYRMTAVSLGLRFAGGLKNVQIVLSGMSDLKQLKDNIRILENVRALTEEEKTLLSDAVQMFNAKKTIPCTSCKYCVGGCPKQIQIPEYFGLYNTQYIFGMGDNYIQNALNISGGKPSECIKCGKCDSICPQKLPVCEYMEKVSKLFE